MCKTFFYKKSRREFLYIGFLICFIFLVSVLYASSSYGQWKKLWQFPHSIVEAVYFLDSSLNSNIGFCSVYDQFLGGEVWKTSNGGLTWQKTTISTPIGPIEDFTFKDSLTGWFATQDGVTACYKTLDGGRTWTTLNATSLYACRGIFFNSSLDLLLLSCVTCPYLSLSKDEGLTWTYTNQLPAGLGFSFFTSMIGIGGSGDNGTSYTSDGGNSWSIALNPAPESYQPLAIKNSSKCFSLCEVCPALYSSDDYGHSFTKIYDFSSLGTSVSGTVISGCIHGDLKRLTIQSIVLGALYSIDEGHTWNTFCGPNDVYDTRFFMKGDSVFMGDTSGGLWLNTTGIGSNSTPQLSLTEISHAIVLGCNQIDSSLTFTFFDSCNNIQAKLDTVFISGSANFSFSSPSAIPRTIHPNDSLIISYNPASTLPDTAQLHLRFHLGWKDFDTVVQLFGAGRIPKETVRFMPSAANYTSISGGYVDVSYQPDKNLSSRGLDSISFDLVYDGDLLDYQGVSTSIPGAVITLNPIPALPLEKGKEVVIRGSNMTLDSLQAIADIKFRAMVTQTMQTPITMANLQLNSGDASYANCVLSADTTNSSFTLSPSCGDSSLRGFLKGVLPLKIISLRPNPAQEEVIIDLQSGIKQDISLEIYDALGEKVLTDARHLSGGSNSLRLDTKALSGGVYLLRLYSPNGETSQSFVKIR